MKPVISQVKHDPPNSYGDCVRACIASLLELDPPEVPHFADNGVDWTVTLDHIREWLRGRSMSLFMTGYPNNLDLDGILNFMAVMNPGIHYMLFGRGHVVICKDDKVVHDPAWYKTRLQQPIDPLWLVGVICHG